MKHNECEKYYLVHNYVLGWVWKSDCPKNSKTFEPTKDELNNRHYLMYNKIIKEFGNVAQSGEQCPVKA